MVSAKYEQGKHSSSGRFFNTNDDGWLELKENFLSTHLNYFFQRRGRFRPFLSAGILMGRVKLIYDDSSINLWNSFKPIAFELGAGTDFEIRSDIALYLKARILMGEKHVSLSGLATEFDYKLDDIFFELGTTYYFYL